MSLEIQIRQYLSKILNPETVAKKLIETQGVTMNTSEFHQFIRFLIISGLDQLAAERLIMLAQNNLELSWDLVGHLFDNYNTSIPKEYIEEFESVILKEKKACAQASKSQFFRNSPKGDQIFNSAINKQKEDKNNFRKIQIEKLRYLHSQRLYHEEEKLISELDNQFPNDVELAKSKDELNQIKRKNIFKQKQTDNRIDDYEKRLETFELNENKIIYPVLNDYVTIAKNFPIIAYDLAISIYMMGYSEYALQIIQSLNNNDKSVLWFKLELLLITNRSLECLSLAEKIIQDFENESETMFAATYMKAQALFNLGQKANAIQIMESICGLRPNYRGGANLLVEWKKIDF